jgi:hypothetical protein
LAGKLADNPELSDSFRGVKGMRAGCKIKIAQRQYDGELYGVNVGGKETWTTDGHQFTVRFKDTEKWCTYLMRRV